LSKGELWLSSSNPFNYPFIDPLSLSDERDLVDFVEAVKHTRNVFNQTAMDEFNGGEHAPG